MTAITSELRALIRTARRHEGLSRAELAMKAGVSEIRLRQIENGYASSARPDTLGALCYAAGIEPMLLRVRKYVDVAEAVEASIMLQENAIPDHLIDSHDDAATAEAYLRSTPGTTRREQDLLVAALHQSRRQPKKRGRREFSSPENSMVSSGKKI